MDVALVAQVLSELAPWLALGAALAFIALVALRLRRRRRVRRAVRALAGSRGWSARQMLERTRRTQRRVERWRRLDAALTHTALGRVLRAQLAGAGLNALSVGRFLLNSAGTSLVGALVAWLAGLIWADGAVTYAVGGAVAGILAPLVVVRVKRGRRLETFAKQLPEATDALAAALKAGASPPQAMERVARELRAPVADELRRVLTETNYGLSWSDALHNLQRRAAGGGADADVKLLASAIAVQQSVGGDLADVLRTLAETMRERLRLRAEMRVHTAQSRYQAYVIAALPLLLFTFFWFSNRAYIEVLLEPHMRHLLFGALGLMGTGFFCMQRIVTQEV